MAVAIVHTDGLDSTYGTTSVPSAANKIAAAYVAGPNKEISQVTEVWLSDADKKLTQLDSWVKRYDGVVAELIADNQTSLIGVAEYDSGRGYGPGDMVLYNGKIYVGEGNRVYAIEWAPGAKPSSLSWMNIDWREVGEVGAEITDVKRDITLPKGYYEVTIAGGGGGGWCQSSN